MHNPLSDSELDEMSREAAGGYRAPGHPDWEKLSGQLDLVLPVDKRKRRTAFWWWFFPAAVVAVGSYWLVTEHNAAPAISVTQPAQNTAATEQRIPANGNVPPASPGMAARPVNPGSPSVQSGGERSVSHAAKTDNQSAETASTDELHPAKATDLRPAAAVAADAGKTGSVSKTMNGQTLASNGSENTRSGNTTLHDQTIASASATETVSAVTKEKNSIADQQLSTTDSGSTTQDAAKASPATESLVKIKTPLRPQGKGFSVAVVAGLDMSTVKFRYSNHPGVNLGLVGGYHFNNRLSIHTGVIYTQKNYKMAGADFTAPKGSWISYYKLTSVEGYCRMFEVPLVLRYGIASGNTHRYFASTGLSSYFMTKESYQFAYPFMGNNVTRSAVYRSSESHLFSVLHLSGGWEKRLSGKLSLQVEPYAKLPLTGLGTGQFRLASFGVNFGLQLRADSK